jgi:general stress protein YciG
VEEQSQPIDEDMRADEKKKAAAEPEEGTQAEGEPERPMTIEEAARKGGNTTKERYGPDFYSRIGRKGGQRVAKERGPEFYSEIGRKGGEARVAQSRKLERERTEEEE